MEQRQKSTSGGEKIGIAFIACSKTKKAYSCPAKEMYQGALFKKALRYSLKNYQDVYILSAKYGVLSLDTIIDPYEKTLNKMSKKERMEWYGRVENVLQTLQGPFTFFAGKLYNAPFKGEKPLTGLGLGQQLQWFTKRLQCQTFLI
jgi:hypothetical protein